VTIGIECPHCETLFQLDPSVVGRAIRCPNPDCREIFEAQSTTVPLPVPVSPTAKPAPQVVPYIEGEAVPAPPKAAIPAVAVGKSLPPLPAAPAADQAKKVVAWNEDQPAPKPVQKPEPLALPRRKPAEEADDIPISTRKKKPVLNKLILAALVVGTLAMLGIGGWFVFRKIVLDEQQMAKQAEKEYADGKFGEASKQYEELAREYPTSEYHEKYEFFAQLAATQAAIGSVTTRENPTPALKAFDTFLAERGDSGYAKPETGFGVDVLQAGQKLTNALGDHAADRIKAYIVNRKQAEELQRAKQAITDGRGVLSRLQPFRGKEEQPSPDAENRFVSLSNDIAKEEQRLELLKPWRSLAEAPTDDKLAQFEQAMKAAGLSKDAEVQEIEVAGKKRLRQLVGFTREVFRALPNAPSATPFAYATPVIEGFSGLKAAPDAKPETVFAMAQGILSALDAFTGEPLWSLRVGLPTTDPKLLDLPLQYTGFEGEIDWVFVATAQAENGEAGLSARRARTGEVLWYLPLVKPCLGRPLLFAGHLYVPLADELGTVLQVRVSTGEQLGKFEIRQPIGASLGAFAGQRRGHGFLVVPADARRVFIFEIGKEDADGRAVNPRPVLVLATDHAKDTLRGELLLVGSESPNAIHRLVLMQSDGPTKLKLRSFALPKFTELVNLEEAQEIVPKNVNEASLAGWAWFAPISDGERIAITTDAGEFAVFGINQQGNSDAPLFRIPTQKVEAMREQISRGQIISADDDSYWVLVGGSLMRMRTAVDALAGMHIIPHGKTVPLGEPVVRAQVISQLNLGYVVFRPKGSAALRMVAFDLQTGTLRWQRQLGIPAAAAAIPVNETSALIVDDGGGVYRLEDAAISTITSPRIANLANRANVVLAPDRRDVWVIAPSMKLNPMQRTIRKYTEGKLVSEADITLTERIAGLPIVQADRLILPLANGFLVRCDGKSEALQKGPIWRGGTTRADAVCYLSSMGSDDFFATDGNTKATRWSWPADAAQPKRIGIVMEVSHAIVAPVAAHTQGDATALAFADANGTITLFDAKAPREPMRKWRGHAEGAIPAGVPSDLQFVFHKNETRLIYLIDRTAIICLNPNEEKPAWLNAEKPQPNAGQSHVLSVNGSLIVQTFQSGQVREWNWETGTLQHTTAREAGSPTTSVNAIVLNEKTLLLPQDDGSIGRISRK